MSYLTANMQEAWGHWITPFGAGWLLGLGTFIFAILIVWSVIWKGLALWKAARLGSKPWFVVLLIVNTLGLLEILYLYVFSRKSQPANQ